MSHKIPVSAAAALAEWLSTPGHHAVHQEALGKHKVTLSDSSTMCAIGWSDSFVGALFDAFSPRAFSEAERAKLEKMTERSSDRPGGYRFTNEPFSPDSEYDR